MICLLIALTFEFLVVKESMFSKVVKGDQDSKVIQLIGKNLHLIGSSIVLLIPFAIFNEKKHTKIVAPIVLLLSLSIVYFSGSAQVTILACFLCIIYVLYSINYKRSIKYLVLIGFMGIISTALYTASINDRQSYIIDEFYQQNDRLLMWNNSLKLFAESPIIGHGKNNWPIEFGKYGYNEYKTFKSEVFDFKRFTHPHNSIFSIISEGGIIGIIIYIYLFVLPCLRLFNERKLLSNLEIAAICTSFMFFLLSLIYGTVFNFYDSFQGLNIIAIIGLAILSHKSNKSVYIGMFSSKLSNGLILLASLFCLQFFYTHYHTSIFFKKLASTQRNENFNSKENSLSIEYSKSNYAINSNQASILATNIFKQNKMSEGIDVLTKALDRDPYNVKLLSKLSQVQLNMENHELAYSLAIKANKLKKNLFEPQLLIGKCEVLLEKDSMSIFKLCHLKNKLTRISKANQENKPNGNLIIKRRKKRRLKHSKNMLKDVEIFLDDHGLNKCK